MPDKSLEQYLYPSSSNGKENGNRNGNGSYLYSVPPLESNTSFEEDEDSIDLRQLLNVCRHRSRLIGLFALGITAASVLWTFIQEPKYQGSFQLLVEPISKQRDQSTLSILGQDWGGLDYETQIEVLRSPENLRSVVSELVQKYPELEYGDLIKLRNSPLEIKQIDETKILEIAFTDTDREKIDLVLTTLSRHYLEYSLAERRAEVNQGIEFVGKELPGIQGRVDKLQEQLQNFRQKHDLLDPEQRAETLSDKKVAFEQKYFDTQIELVETKALFTKLQNQLGKNPQEAITNSYLSDSPRYQNLLAELQEVELELARESVRFSPQNPVIIGLEERKANLIPLLEREAIGVLGRNFNPGVDFTTSAPSPSSLRSQLDIQYIQAANTTEILELRASALEASLAELDADIEGIPKIAREYTELQRDLTVATESLNRFLSAQEELQLEAARQALPWQLIAGPIQKEDPVSPSVPRNLALGMIGGLMLGMGAALLAERLDPVFHSSEEIKESIKLPMLGIIPVEKDLVPTAEYVSEEEEIILPQLQIGGKVLDLNASESDAQIGTTAKVPSRKIRKRRYNASPFSEAFRSLNTNIRLLGSDSSLNSIVISSSIPSEGKSTISSHLAQAAAAMGQRVLLIDADLRRPQAHLWTGLDNDNGLSNVLSSPLPTEDEIELKHLIEQTVRQPEEWEGLSVITAGEIPPDPTRLLSSQRMYKVMDILKESGKYDLIIYDTPPILGFADGRILANRTNGVVLVVRIGKTDRSLVKQNIDNLRVSHVPVLGIVANHASYASGDSYHYYNKYYTKRD